MKKRMHGAMIALAVAATLAPAVREADAGARRSRPVKTGQTTCWNEFGTAEQIDCAGTGQDGDLQRGEPRSQVDQGDGTIRDKRTALTWEKLSDDGSIHDKDNQYTFDDGLEKIDELNAEPCFAGFCDWRMPNAFELGTILNLENSSPAVSAVFNTNCTGGVGGNPGCTILTCSCSTFFEAWTSTTDRAFPQNQFIVLFNRGFTSSMVKTAFAGVRAVRGGAQ